MVTSLPSTTPPGPTAITSASCGFSCAALAKIIPDLVFSSAFNCFNTTLSDNGQACEKETQKLLYDYQLALGLNEC